ncbi:MAG: tRNA (guanosine(37)-N1)-methyltransferase TrmD [Chloroflexi bacterium]|nr:tRNA (guanosine(37)-N1)-methyltransferase TrmD [Chloroflexota bacterium]|tara:strand:- start:154 stop:840 length:687 start_codon:yes stop_codon:yes gene_type:complete
MKNIDIITLFPEIIEDYISSQPFSKNISPKVKIKAHQLRDFSPYKHRQVDDKQYGIEPGMVLMPEPLSNAVDYIEKKRNNKCYKILFSPQGKLIDSELINNLYKKSNLIFVCGRYEGVDERFIEEKIDLEISVGDFVVSGGELPALLLLEAMSRLSPGFLGNEKSLLNDSFGDNFKSILKGPVYTKPNEYRGKKVPKVLLSGDHKKILQWRKEISLARTKKRRDDLIN